MDIHQEEINKLLLDPGFRNWALRSNVDDFEAWENTIKGDRQLALLAEEAKKMIIEVELSDSNPGQSDLDSFHLLKVKLKQSDNPEPQIKKYGTKRIQYIKYARIAAVVTFFIVFAGLLYFNNGFHATGQDNIAMVQKLTQNGQQLSITLPDGSKVKLNSNSSVSYSEDFMQNRKVHLDGEAFFNVVRDESNPFIVVTNQFQTEVLGTSFNVSAYENTYGKVSVAEGKVLVSSLHNQVENDHVIITQEEAVEIVAHQLHESVFEKDEILWKEGILVFTNESIQTAVKKIERWFNVEVLLENESSIAGDFSGKYVSESLEEILKGMGYALNFSFKMEGNEIIIKGKN